MQEFSSPAYPGTASLRLACQASIGCQTGLGVPHSCQNAPAQAVIGSHSGTSTDAVTRIRAVTRTPLVPATRTIDTATTHKGIGTCEETEKSGLFLITRRP
jgi:hypothetical protein